MMNTNIISSTDVQRNFAQVLQKLRSSHEPLVVVRDSVPEAVMLEYQEYRRLFALEKQLVTARFEKLWEEMAKHNANISDKELNADIERAKRYGRIRK